MTEAESFINVVTGYNWSDTYSSENADVKGILKEAASNLAAIYVLNYDYSVLTAVTTRFEMEDRIGILLFRFNECIKILKETGSNKFIQDA